MPPPRGSTRRNASNSKSATDTTSSSLAPTPSIRKRKVNPDLKDRAEAFLASANPPSRSSTGPAAKRRKVMIEKPPPRSLAKGAEFEPLKNVPASRAVSESSQGRSSKKEGKPPEEKRLRVFRKAPPRSYLQKLERAQTQRMVVLSRKRIGEQAFPSEEIELVGSTGNVYKVTVGLEPKCTCPDYLKGNQCKHIVYCLVNVLKAPANLQYQLAFLSSELREIFAKAPPIPTETDSADDTSGKRKPVDGECPICYMDFDEAHNEIVWCRAACGNNMHKSCFDQWVASQRGSVVKCVYCRSPWQSDNNDLSQVAQKGIIGEDGYVNVAHLTGQSTVRDVRTYHQHWVRRNYFGMGY